MKMQTVVLEKNAVGALLKTDHREVGATPTRLPFPPAKACES